MNIKKYFVIIFMRVNPITSDKDVTEIRRRQTPLGRSSFVFPVVGVFEFVLLINWQSNGKAEKFSCVLWRLEMLREFEILVSFRSFQV